ncbi:MAG TPA: hypothetical protein IAC03_04845 [Candidatus Coprenecus pullistercoris]|nr:hypothetical protein [Candidatus Coprenecus pullistercoris]
MDTLLLSRTLMELIIDHDRIPLPGIGCFLIRTTPAAFSEDGKTIYPPRRTLLFEEDCSIESGEMSAYYSRMGISHLLEQFKEALDNRQETVLDGLGKFQYTAEGRLQFTYDTQNDILARAFGFEPIPLKPLAAKSQAEEPDMEPVQQETAMESVPSAVPSVTEETAADKADDTGRPEISGRHRSGRTWIIILVSILAFIIIAAIALVELGRSGCLDSLIYSDEELELIRQMDN